MHTSLCPWLADYILQRKNENFINALIYTIVFSSSIQEILNSVKKKVSFYLHFVGSYYDKPRWKDDNWGLLL